MKKKTKIIILILILLLFGGLLTFFIINNKNKKLITEDSLKFKEDYESVNGKKVSDELSYSSLDIPKNNPMKYSSYEEIFKILDNGTGVIYLGFPECPWCRNIVPVLIDTALKSKVETIYYLNIKDDRNVLSLTKKGKIKTEKTEVPKLDIRYDKFVVIQTERNHTVLLNLDNVTVIEEIKEDLM